MVNVYVWVSFTNEQKEQDETAGTRKINKVDIGHQTSKQCRSHDKVATCMRMLLTTCLIYLFIEQGRGRDSSIRKYINPRRSPILISPAQPAHIDPMANSYLLKTIPRNTFPFVSHSHSLPTSTDHHFIPSYHPHAHRNSPSRNVNESSIDRCQVPPG